MENTYGIGVKNRYELFYDEEVDPLEILRQQEEERERRKIDKTQKDRTKGGKGGKQVTAVPPKKNIKETVPAPTPKSTEPTDTNKPRGRYYGDRTIKPSGSFDEPRDIEDKKNRRNREEVQHFSTPEVRDRGDGEFRRGRGGGRGRGRGRGRGGGGGGGSGGGGSFSTFEGRGRREFDRQSGSERSGVRPVDKRDGGGAHNWGNVKDDFEAQQTTTPNEETTEVAERPVDENVLENTEAKENEPGPIDEEVVGEPVEEGPREMTLDEWKKEQESKRSVPKYNLRKPGEGEDGAQWKKLYVLKKKNEEEEEDEEEEEEGEEEEEYGRRGRQRQLVDIQINFSDSRRGRGRGRGGRGTSGRGGNRGVNRSGPKGSKSPQQSAPKVDDWNDFPSLVTA